MTSKSIRRLIVAATLSTTAFHAKGADAQCCGMGTTAYYQPAAVTAYSPVAYQASYTGWYPGYFLDRIRARMWGSPTTYVAAYPTTYTAAYAPAYTAAYAPAHTAAYRPAYAASYSTSYAPATSYAAPASCATCPSYTASYAPAASYAAPAAPSTCSTCTASYAPPSCPPCAPCPSCPTPVVAQTTYQQPTACPPCAAGATTGGYGSQPGNGTSPTPAPQRTFDSQNGAPSLEPSANVPGDRPQEAQRPTNGTQQDIQPEPADDNNTKDPYDTSNDEATNGASFFQAPKLFDPNDRTARHGNAPVTTALYQKPVSYRSVSMRPISAQQAQQDAIGWTSASQ